MTSRHIHAEKPRHICRNRPHLTCYHATRSNNTNKSVFSFLRQLTMWHCPHPAARLLMTAGRLAVQQSIDVSWPPGPQQQTRSSGVRRPDGTDRRTDRRTPDSCTDPAADAARQLVLYLGFLSRGMYE